MLLSSDLGGGCLTLTVAVGLVTTGSECSRPELVEGGKGDRLMFSLGRLPTTTLSHRFARKVDDLSTPRMDNASIVASVTVVPSDAGKTSLTGADRAAADAAIAKALGSVLVKTDPALNLPAALKSDPLSSGIVVGPLSSVLDSMGPDPDVTKSLAVDSIVTAAIISITAATNSAYAINSELVSVPPCSDLVRSEFAILPISSNFGRGGAVMEFPPALLGFGLLDNSDALSASLHFAPASADSGWSGADGRPVWTGQGRDHVMQVVGLPTRVSLIQIIPTDVIHGQDLDVQIGCCCRSRMSDLMYISMDAGKGFPTGR